MSVTNAPPEMLSLAELQAHDPSARPGPAEWRFLCPFPGCGDGKRADGAHRSLSVRVSDGVWQCFRCGRDGKVREHWTDRPMLTWAERRLAPLRRALTIPRDPEPKPLPDAGAWWVERFTDAPIVTGTPGGDYLEGRGIPADFAAALDVRYTANWYGRAAVLYPLRTRAGELVAVDGRFLDTVQGKPKTQSAGAKSLGAFATPGAYETGTWIIAEGPADALSLALCGFPCIALSGKSWPDWLPRACAFKRVAVGLDGDEPGQQAAGKLTAVLEAAGARVDRWLPRGGDTLKDWNEALILSGRDAFQGKVFRGAAGPRYQAVWQWKQRRPHQALEEAIDTQDWQAFLRELAVWERS